MADKEIHDEVSTFCGGKTLPVAGQKADDVEFIGSNEVYCLSNECENTSNKPKDHKKNASSSVDDDSVKNEAKVKEALDDSVKFEARVKEALDDSVKNEARVNEAVDFFIQLNEVQNIMMKANEIFQENLRKESSTSSSPSK